MENKLIFWFLQFFIFSLKRQLVSAEPPKFPCYFIFGDSTVDNGNNNNLNTEAKVNYLPYGIDYAHGPTGRFSNGRNIADIIGEFLGFENHIPPYATTRDQDMLTGVNYGSGGAGILDETGYHLGAVISMKKQLVNHRAVMSKIAALLGGEKSAKEYLSKCIYTVAMGGNDISDYFLPQFYSSSSQFTPEQFASILIIQYSKQLSKLYEYGARKVSVQELGKLGCCPAASASASAVYGWNERSCVEPINNAAKIFDDKLKQLLHHLNNLLPDANFITTNADPDTYGNITVLNTPCCDISDGGLCLPGAGTCNNRDEYMFWDGFHPTDAANLLSAEKVYREMSPLFTNITDVE